MDKKDLIETAQKRVEDKKKFYSHLNAFCIVAFTLFLINYITTPGTWWFLLATIGWAIAVLGHYLSVFGFPSFRDEIWEQQQIELEIKKIERQGKSDSYQNDTLEISNDKLELKELEKNRQEYDIDDFV